MQNYQRSHRGISKARERIMVDMADRRAMGTMYTLFESATTDFIWQMKRIRKE